MATPHLMCSLMCLQYEETSWQCIHCETTTAYLILITWYIKHTLHILSLCTYFMHTHMCTHTRVLHRYALLCPVSHIPQPQRELLHQAEWPPSSLDGPVYHTHQPSGTVEKQHTHSTITCVFGKAFKTLRDPSHAPFGQKINFNFLPERFPLNSQLRGVKISWK